MRGNHAVFVGGNAEYLYRAVGLGDSSLLGLIGGAIQDESQAGEGSADQLAYQIGMLADSARKDQAIHTSQNRQKTTDHLAHTVGQSIDGEGGVWLVVPGRQQHLHVATDAGQTEQTGEMVQDPFKLIGGIALFLEQKKKHPGVEITATGAHDYAARGAEPHAGIHADAVPHCRQTGAIPQVRDDAPAGLGNLGADVFIRESMKTIFSYPFLPQIAGQGVARRQFWNTVVKGGIEAGELWGLRPMLVGGLHDGNLGRKMQRGKTQGCPEGLQYQCIDAAVLAQVWAAGNDAVPNRRELLHTQLLETVE